MAVKSITLTHKGWVGIVPVYAGVYTGPCMPGRTAIIVARTGVPNVLLDAQLWVLDRLAAFYTWVTGGPADHDLVITGELDPHITLETAE